MSNSVTVTSHRSTNPGILPPPMKGAKDTSAATPTGRTAASKEVAGVRDVPAVIAPPVICSVSSDAIRPQKVVMNGFGGNPIPKPSIALNLKPGQGGIVVGKDIVDNDGWATRGYFDVNYKPAVGGVDVDIECRQARPKDPENYQGDEMVLQLQARVLDQGRERVITLATLLDGVMNTDKLPVSRCRYHIDYADISKWLKEKNPNLKFVPGDPLAIYGIWKDEGHQWGGFCRGGYFESPQPLGRNNALAVRNGGATGAVPVSRTTEFIEKPIDITMKVPDDLIKKYDKVLVPGAKMVSRREHEQKFCARSLDELGEKVKQLLGVCQAEPYEQEEWLLQMMGRDDALSQMAGYDISGWHIKTTDRYYARDAQGAIKIGRNGLPEVAPMVDAYQDNVNGRFNKFIISRDNMAIRFRDGEIKSGETLPSMGKLNMKTTRLVDPFTLTQTGLEYSLDTRYGISSDPEALDQLEELLDKSGPPYSPLDEINKFGFAVKGDCARDQAVVNVANRYKFTLEHENGMELEVSMDFVHAGITCKTIEPATTKNMFPSARYDYYASLFGKDDGSVVVTSTPALKTGVTERSQVVVQDGQELVMAQLWMDADGTKHVSEHPCVRFPQVEIEMDHVQARSTGPTQSAYSSPYETTIIDNDQDQDEFLKSVGEQVTMNGPPMIHIYDDLKHPRTYESQDYRQMQDAVVKFREHLFPDGVLPARQKAAQALEMAGVIPEHGPKFVINLPRPEGSNIHLFAHPYASPPSLWVQGQGTIGTPVTAQIYFNEFPIFIDLDGTETPKQLAELVQARLDKSVFYKAVLEEAEGDDGPEYHVHIIRRNDPGEGPSVSQNT